MTQDEIKDLAQALASRNQNQDTLKRWLLPVLVGLSIAFVGWFANKSSRDIENVTTINKTLEFMQLTQQSTNDALNGKVSDLRTQLEAINEKLAAPRFTREDFNREMLYRDQDIKRVQAQLEEILAEINNRRR